jgi:type IV secretion system protein VirB6
MVAVGHLANSGSGISGRILVAVLTVVVLATGAVMLSVALFNIVLAQAATAILLALTPLFFVFLLFQATREMFWKWWGQLWNYFFLVLLTYVVLSMFLGIIRSTARLMRLEVQAGGAITLDLVAPFLLITLVATFLLFVVHGMATGLGGGVAMNTAAAAKVAGTKAAGWANRGHKAFGRGVDSAMARSGLSGMRARSAGVGFSRAGGGAPNRSGVSAPEIGSGLSKSERTTGQAESQARRELRDLDK